MSAEARVVAASPERVVGVVERMVDLPWPDGDDSLTWELDGLGGESLWLTHVLPLAWRAGPDEVAALAGPLAELADRRWGPHEDFDATRFTDDASTDPARYDRRSAVAGAVRSLGAPRARWWRYEGHAVLLVDGSTAQPDDTTLAVLVLPVAWLSPSRDGDPERSPLVADLLSGDRERILTAVWALMSTRDPAVLGPVAAALPTIRRATAELDLGGAFVRNASHLAAALARAELSRTRTCLCTTYPDHLFHDPAREEARGHVRIVGEVPNDRQWEPDRVCECTDCGRRWQVEHGEYHYPWWKWTLTGKPRARDA